LCEYDFAKIVSPIAPPLEQRSRGGANHASAPAGILFGTALGVILVSGLHDLFGTLAEGKTLNREEHESPVTEGDVEMTGRRSSGSAALVCSALLLSGCVPALPQGEARQANTTVPDDYRSAGGESSTGAVAWREFFADPHLVALVDEALEHNQELNIAVQENFIASYEIMARRGEILPQLNVGAGAGLERVSESSSQGVSDEVNNVAPNLQSYGFGLYATWEVDIWNRLRNLADAAANEYLASVQGRYFMTTVLVSEIASLYYELMALDRQLEVVSNTIVLQSDALAMVRLQWQAGRTTALAVRRFEAELLE
jgi:outer membrane protein TolC